jgi:signal transduction histidine kinase
MSGAALQALAVCAILIALAATVVAVRAQVRVRSIRDQARRDRQALLDEVAAGRRRADAAVEDSRRTLAEQARFLAAASHDLRQPIHAVTLFVAALKLEPLEGRARYFADRLDRSLAGLDELFGRLLDIARLDGGSIVPHRRSVGIAGLLRPLGARFEALAAERGLGYRVRIGPDLAVLTDPALLIEIVMNLLSNAFRYTERGGVLLAVRRRGDTLRIEVWDTGIGIAAEHLDRVFDDFVQLGNPSRDRRRGVGLGLSVVRRISARLGHELTVRSRPGRGSMFAISVPIDPNAPPPIPAPQDDADPTVLRGLLVLVVDNELEVLLATEALLRAWGCLVLIARTVQEASKWVAESERFPDVLVTDYRLSGDATGADVIRSVRQQVPTPLGILVVSAEPAGSVPGLGADDECVWLPKPIDPARMRHALIDLARRYLPGA